MYFQDFDFQQVQRTLLYTAAGLILQSQSLGVGLNFNTFFVEFTLLHCE